MTESNLKFNFGQKVKSLSESFKLTQEQFAEKINLERDTISKIENGRRFPSCASIEKIAQTFNISYSLLFSFDTFDNTKNYDDALSLELEGLSDKDKEFILSIIRLYKNTK